MNIERYTSSTSRLYVLLMATVLVLVSPGSSKADTDVFISNRLLGRGMNFGDALEAPQEGAWGVTLKAEYFQAIKDAGFNSVRIPIRWSAHAQTDPPYAIDPAFFERVDWAIDQALFRNLSAVINVHHYSEMDQDPGSHTQRLAALWKQIATRYQHRPPTLFFELLNEPNDNLTDERWQQIFPELLQAIRETNANRTVIVGPASWNSLDHLTSLKLPQDDHALIATFHYYKPVQFTHQGADWVPKSEAWRGTKWGSPQDRDELQGNFERAAAWARQNERPIYLGEFGAIGQADMPSRILWTEAVTREAEKMNFSWSYWEFCAKFGAYDRTAGMWREPLLRALLDR